MELIQLDETRRDAALANEAHKKRARRSATKMSNPVSSQKATWSYFTTKNPINWEQVNLSLYGWAPILLNEC